MSQAAFAFFDVDDTLLAVKSMFDFYRHLCLEEFKDPVRLEAFEADFRALRAVGTPREQLNHRYYTYFKGLSEAALDGMAERWWRDLTQRRPDLFFAEAVALLRGHQRAGIVPVFVSGSCAALLRPLAKVLEVTEMLAAPLLLDGQGYYTGLLGTPQTIGVGKKLSIELFLRSREAQPSRCYAYGDDISDEPMLSAVGNPVAVGAGTPLAILAARRGWPVLPIGNPAPLPAWAA
jgi:HAD superfamily hydrolase (TIGR01490 family)